MACFGSSVLIVFLVPIVYGITRIDPLVDTNVGLIKGLRASDGDYSMFLGIPFAKVDENNPFGASIPYPKFEGVFEAFDDSAICPQIDQYNRTVAGTLDCLHLNIYVPNAASSRNRLPVLIWIYGGGFRMGYGNRFLYGPNFLVRHDVILVTLNYRLGPYGFMCLDTTDVPGNQGIKDQLLALRWINKNIEAFGGDSNKVTVFGESAGAITIDFHLLSNNEILFHKAILQSGTTQSPVIYEPVKTAPQMIANYLGFSTNDLNEALNFISKIDSELIIAASNSLDLDFRPCIEKHFDGVESIVTENWLTEAIPKIRNMPILIGFNDDERIGAHAFGDDEHFKSLNLVERHLYNGFDVDNENFDGMQEFVQHFYFGDEPVTAEVKRDVINLESDFMYIHPTYRTIEKYMKNDVGNIFFYVFSYVGGRNYDRSRLNIPADFGGAAHADEKGYLFDISYMQGQPIAPNDQRMIDQITTLWTNFVKYGDPTPQTTEILPVEWIPITKDSLFYYLNIGSELSLGTRPFHGRSAFWDLFYKENKHLQRAYPRANVEL